jgi:GNAT superfamily N-acetyltransferase
MPSVRLFDVTDAAEFDDWMRVTKESVSDQPHALVWSVHDVRNMFEQPSAYVEVRGYVCRDDDGAMVGWGLMDLPMADNTSTAYVSIGVPPTLRGRGFGTRLAETMAAEAAAAGRTIASVHAGWPGDAETSPARRFAERNGLTLRQTMLHQVLTLPVDDAVLEDLARSVQEHHAAYWLLTWDGSCPPEWVEEFCVLRARMNVEAPRGDLELEAEVFDAARLAEEHEQIVARRQRCFTTVAVAPDGTLAAYSLLVGHLDDPRVDQWDTLVVGDHRGHRLGLAVKLANLRALRDSGLAADKVNTWNATTNAPMIAINTQLGFHTVKYTGEFQGPIPAGVPG